MWLVCGTVMCLVPRCDKAGTGEKGSQARSTACAPDTILRSWGTGSVGNEDSPRVVRFRERREN